MSSVKAVHRFKHYSGAFGEADSASFLARIERELAEDDEIMRVSEQLLAQTPTLPPPPLDATASDPAAAAAAVIADATPHLQRPPSWASLPKLTMQYHHVVTATKAATAAAPTVTGPSSQLLLPQNKAALAFSNLSKRNSSSSNSSSSNSSSSSSSSGDLMSVPELKLLHKWLTMDLSSVLGDASASAPVFIGQPVEVAKDFGVVRIALGAPDVRALLGDSEAVLATDRAVIAKINLVANNFDRLCAHFGEPTIAR